MQDFSRVKVVTFVPQAHADNLRNALGKAGAGRIGNYSYCSYSTQGVGRFVPSREANPTIGKKNQLNLVSEERVEVVCDRSKAKTVVDALKMAHPYDEVAFDIYPLIDEERL